MFKLSPWLTTQRFISGVEIIRKCFRSQTCEKDTGTRRNTALWRLNLWLCGNCMLRDGWRSVRFSCCGLQAADGCRVMTHMPMLLHLHRLPRHGNTLPGKAEGTLMGGRRNVYLFSASLSGCELIKQHCQSKLSQLCGNTTDQDCEWDVKVSIQRFSSNRLTTVWIWFLHGVRKLLVERVKNWYKSLRWFSICASLVPCGKNM